MRKAERVSLWVLIFSMLCLGAYFFMLQTEENRKLTEENRKLIVLMQRVQANQEQLNTNFRSFSETAEKQLTTQSRELQSITTRIGMFRATKDSTSGAIVWE